jgi:hypothetical protein
LLSVAAEKGAILALETGPVCGCAMDSGGTLRSRGRQRPAPGTPLGCPAATVRSAVPPGSRRRSACHFRSAPPESRKIFRTISGVLFSPPTALTPCRAKRKRTPRGCNHCRGIAWRAHRDDDRSAEAPPPRSAKTPIGSADPYALKIPARRAECSFTQHAPVPAHRHQAWAVWSKPAPPKWRPHPPPPLAGRALRRGPQAVRRRAPGRNSYSGRSPPRPAPPRPEGTRHPVAARQLSLGRSREQADPATGAFIG